HCLISIGLVDHGIRADSAKRVKRATTKSCEGSECDDHRECWCEPDGREQHRTPHEGKSGEPGTDAIGQQTEGWLTEAAGTRVGKGDEADGLEIEIELVREQGIEHRQQSAEHIDTEMPEGERHEWFVAKNTAGRSHGDSCK